MIGYWIVIGIILIAIVAVLLAVSVSPEGEDAEDSATTLRSADATGLAPDNPHPEP